MVDRVHPSADASSGTADARRVGPIPEMLAAIDIGTNSVHMVVARTAGGGRFEVVTKHKETVRLGEGGDVHLKRLTPDAIDRGIAALRRCRAILDTYGAPVSAMATSAVREAENRDEFIGRALDEAGIVVEVIAGHEEARLIHLGVLQALPVFERRLLLCDIGGGSTELLVGHRGEVLSVRSFKLGAIRLTRRFFPDGVIDPGRVDAARRFIRATIVPFVREARRHRIEVSVGSSGTIENLANIARLAAGDDGHRPLNGTVLTRAGLDGAVESLLAASTAEDRAAIAGIDAGRSDIIVGGALILEQVMDGLGLSELTVSEYALREGILFDLAARLAGATSDHLSDLRRRSIEHLMESCDDDPAHSLQVARLALELFDGLTGDLGLEHLDREILEAAALLHNVGLVIAHSRRHLHAYYVIRNSEHLMGFTDHEIELIALVARYQRRGDPSPKHREFAALTNADRGRVAALAALLRIAIGLDRSHGAVIRSITVDTCTEAGSDPDDSPIRLGVRAEPGFDAAIELYAATERSALLGHVTGRRVLLALDNADR